MLGGADAKPTVVVRNLTAHMLDMHGRMEEMTSPEISPVTEPATTAPTAQEAAERRAAQAAAQGAQQIRISESRAKAEGRAQVRPTAEGWKQAMGDDGRPLLQFTPRPASASRRCTWPT